MSLPFKTLLIEEFQPKALQQGDEVNIICGTSVKSADLIEPLFGPAEGEELILLASEDLDWPHLLTQLGCFPSASQAFKNWKAQDRNPEIPPGFSGPLTIGKARKIQIWVWKVIPEE